MSDFKKQHQQEDFIEPKEQANLMPKDPGVYIMKNEAGVIIYIGKAKVLRNRVKSYFVKQKGRPNRLKHLIKQIVKIDYMVTHTEVEAFLLEASLIKKHKPRYNIRLKDDKAYPYIKCSLSADYPRLYVERRVKPGKDIYFGPFTSGYLVRETIKFLNGLYKIRDCTNGFMKARKRACLSYEIKRCTAPCVNLISKEDYLKNVYKAVDFLSGKSNEIVDEIAAKMLIASDNQEYEEAASYRDQMKAADLILEKQRVISQDTIDRDIVVVEDDERGSVVSMIHVRAGRVLGQNYHFLSRLQMSAEDQGLRDRVISFMNQYYIDNFVPDEILVDVDLGKDLTKLFSAVVTERKGVDVRVSHVADLESNDVLEVARKNAKEKLEKFVTKSEAKQNALEEIKEKFGLNDLPERIECFDISNFQGDQSVASQVVFQGGLPSPEDYRKYKIKTVVGPDDFASMKEVLSRRLAHNEYQDPQLIMIDGGKGQLSKALEALKDLGREDIPVVGIAKARTKGEFSDKEVARTQERFFIKGRQNHVTFKNHSEALRVLTHIRDEAHRFAISFHRSLREKATLESALTGLQGMGPKRHERLIEFLKTQKNWSKITVEQIKAETGGSLDLAEKILHIIQNDKK